MAVTVSSETLSIMLTVGEAFVSSTGQKFVSGEIYTLPKEDAMKLLSVKGDYDTRFFKKHEGEVGTKAAPENLEKKEVLPTAEEIGADMKQDANKKYKAAKAVEKADAIASATRGQGDEVLEKQIEQKAASVAAINNTGEIDTAAVAPRKSGKGVAV